MNDEHPSRQRIAIAMSGGGFRATLFHLGAMLFLRDNQMLGEVKHITSVSGGSIAAAYLVKHWAAFKDDKAHVDVVKKLIAFTQRDVVSDVLGWFYRGPLLRTRRLQALYDRHLFEHASLQSLAGEHVPSLYIMATNLTTGEALAFSPNGLHLGSAVRRVRPVAPHGLVAEAVAASSAFPAFFGPLTITRDRLGLSEGEMPREQLYVTDGGVRDNSGLEFLHDLSKPGEPAAFDVLVSLDARRLFDLSDAGKPSLLGLRVLSVLDRSFEIATNQLDTFRENHAAASFVRLTGPSPDGSIVPDNIRGRLRFVRTGFDAFSNAEVYALMAHGYAVAAQQLAALVPPGRPSSQPDWASRLGFEKLPDLRSKNFKDCDSNRIGRRLLWLAARIALVVGLLVPAWWGWQRPRLPDASLATPMLKLASDIKEPWMQALLNDVEREAKSAIGEGQTPGFGAVASRTVVGALRWEPFRRGSRAGVLTAGYEAEKYAVSGYAFRGATSSAKDAYAALATKVKDGRIELFFDGAEPNDTLLLLIAVAAKDQDAPLPNVDRLFSNWSFHE